MNIANQIPATCNESWGFWGEMDAQAPTAWPIAMTAISDATHQPLESVRLFLDSRHGRHFADEVLGLMYGPQALGLERAIYEATDIWMTWTIGRQTSKDYGIPKGLPYLTGFVIACEVTQLSAAEGLAA